MRNLLILLGIIFIVLSVMFGRNPIEEAHEKRELARQGKDDLILSIEDHNKNKLGNMMRGGAALGNAGDAPAPAGSTANPNVYMQRPYTSGPAKLPQDLNQGYYPPAPLPPGQIAPTPSPYFMPQNNGNGPQSNRQPQGLYLRSGQRLQFAGIYVFLTDASGQKKPMPDGVYPLRDGRILLTVRNGKKVIVSN